MEHEQLKELLPLEALDRLEGEERRAMAAHLAQGCEACEAELASFRDALAAMAVEAAGSGVAERTWRLLERRLGRATAEAQAPGAASKGAAEGERASRAAERPVRLPWRMFAMVGAAAALLAIALNVVLLRDRRDVELALADLRDRTQTLEAELHGSREQVATLRRELHATGELTRTALSPGSRMIRLGPLKPAPSASGLLAINAGGTEAVLMVSGLPAPAAGKVYELWWIGAVSGPVRAALFRTGPSGFAAMVSPPPPAHESLVASAVTLEPAGGVDKPTGEAYLKGAVNS